MAEKTFEERKREFRAASGGTCVRVCPDGAPTEKVEARVSGVKVERAHGKNAKDYERIITGYASVTDTDYEMWDYFGAYTERVAAGAFARTLADDPRVAYRIEHRGLGLATTESGSLGLEERERGLWFEAIVDIRQTDAADLVYKLERGVATGTSFAFTVVRQEWSPDYETRTFLELDLDRGDVASCCYGANPHGSAEVDARSVDERVAKVLGELEGLTDTLGAEAYVRFLERLSSLTAEAAEELETITELPDDVVDPPDAEPDEEPDLPIAATAGAGWDDLLAQIEIDTYSND